ncbi:TPR repeat-containing protein [Richelia sinica FACHB-800]|uniref:TPR repeat-containing protein n=1 Tax=Richelia sinica FACHB-800 TaxID=1357546 RepID=A0A975TD35_9NOST|nr:NB-ARC domain-containing protein [Richelia sinica]MBD2667181.1 NB-ARC domain-containing protein [Richelia sinica FACHB-800]QXE25847.1 TPR repeat-containing protein [Richelia sinica FACHB-800]
MNINNAVNFTQSLIAKHTQKPLNDSQMAVLRGSLEGKTYPTIAVESNLSDEYAREIGSELWAALSTALERKVTKNNLISVIKQNLPPDQQKISNSEILTKCNEEARNFVGRNAAINDINDRINEGIKIIVIQASGGVGKTTLAKQYLYKNFDLVLPLEMAKDTENITAVESEIETWLKQYFHEEPGRDFKTTLTRLKQQLQNRRVGILIDNLEPALDKQGRLIEKHSLYVELLRVLGDEKVQSLTLITSRERLCDERIDCNIYHYPLAVLTLEAWGEFFISRKIKLDIPSLEAMHKIYGGNAKAMDILFGVMREDYDRDMAAYWQENSTCVETELKNLVASQFNRLQTLDIDAYKLLCRLGCFRYQDVPRVSCNALLSLLWDVPEDKRRDVIKALRNRCLVEFDKGEYWLHPVIKQQGIERLKASGEWEEVNRKAAKFWNNEVINIITPIDAIQKFESYYHFLIIEDWLNASKVIVKKIGDTELIPKLRGFGYIRKSSEILDFLRDKQNIPNRMKASIFTYQADANSIVGNTKRAIFEYKKSIEFLDYSISSKDYLKAESYIDIRGALGLLYMKIGEYDIAISIFEEIAHVAKRTGEGGKKFLTYIHSCLSVLFSFNKESNFSLKHLQSALDFKSYLENTNKHWIKGYGFYNLIKALVAHNQLKEAIQLCEFLKKYSELTYFRQGEGFYLFSLGDIYRKHNKNQYSLEFYGKSIQIFEEISAKCDLAEAYYQLGLTYQKMGEIENSNTNFNEAIRLYQEIEAPKQVEKVEKAKRENIDSQNVGV